MIVQYSMGPFAFTGGKQAGSPAKQRGGSWGKKDLLKYGIFLYYVSSQQILPGLTTSKWSLYRSLSIFLQSKNPNQCRILHLAMLQKYGCLQDVLRSFLDKYQDFLSLCQKFEPLLKNTLHIITKETPTSSQSASVPPAIRDFVPLESVGQATVGLEKEKEQLRPTDINYQEESEPVIQNNSGQEMRQKRFGISQKRQAINVRTSAGEQCHWGFMDYLQKLAVLGSYHIDSL